MPKLKWISDENLHDAVTHLLGKAREAKRNAVTKFGKNVIDPFSALFEMSGFEINYDDWIISETARQAQKTLQNHLGEFHQKILASCKGWENLNTGRVMDLICKEKMIIAEVKNKFFTIKRSNLSDLYKSMEELVMPKSSIYKNYTAYYAVVIPQKPSKYDKEFTPSDNKKGEKCSPNSKIREIDGNSFYSLVTGDVNALENLFNILPLAIAECSNGTYKFSDNAKLKAFFDLAYVPKIKLKKK
jgi:hypothetical protein